MRSSSAMLFLLAAASVSGCGLVIDLDPPELDAGHVETDGGTFDAGGFDAGSLDAGGHDDAGPIARDEGVELDATSPDAGCGADGTPCADPSGGRHVCSGGVCALSVCGDRIIDAALSEQCDDGNTVDGDGCETTCQFSCVGPGDCDDANACTAEMCAVSIHQCLSSGVACPTDACRTALGCDPTIGCLSELIDDDADGHAPMALGPCGDDCDDSDATIAPGRTETCDGRDENCNGLIDEGAGALCGRDLDGDRFGSSIDTVRSCGPCPAGYVADTRDCWDEVAVNANLAHPGQMTYFTMPRGPAGSGSYDWSCDGLEEPLRSASFVACTGSGTTCDAQSGWVGARPACGDFGVYQPCFTAGDFTCQLGTLSTMAVVACR